VNTRDRNYTPAAVRRRIEQVDASIQRYLAMLDTADRQEGEEVELRTARISDRIDALRHQMRELQTTEQVLETTPDRPISLTDPDARAMATNGKGTGMVGYNVQAAVDTTHHLVVAHEVTNVGHDRSQLANMARQAMAATGTEALTVLADRGYFSGEEVLACEKAGAIPICPRPLTSGAKAEGRWGKQDFGYEARTDTYRCPAGQQLTRRFSSVEKNMMLHTYWSDACAGCTVKGQCTTGKERRIRRWEHEHIVEAMQARLDRMPEAMRVRRRTVEHVFGTFKDWMGRSHFKTRTLDRVGTEMSLHVLAYNLKRVIALLGTQRLIAAMRS